MVHTLTIFEAIWPMLQNVSNTLICIYIYIYIYIYNFFIAHVYIILYIAKEVASFQGLGNLMGVACNRMYTQDLKISRKKAGHL